jgi:hypothetical protein
MIDRNSYQQAMARASTAGRIYIATRTNSETGIVIRTLSQKTALRPRLDLVRHSPIGFDWGINGSNSGSAQLALALLAHASGDDRLARQNYEVFKHEIISRLPPVRWELSAVQILQMLRFVTGDLEPLAPVETAHRKTAVVHALLPGDNCPIAITTRGTGGSRRQAAARAFLNLVGKKQLRRRRVIQMEVELSIFNAEQYEDA